MPTRVALFSPTLESGGSELVQVRLARGFVERGYEVDLVVAEAVGQRVDEVDPRVRLVDLGARPPRALTRAVGLARYLARESPDVLIAADDVVGTCVWARAVVRARTRVVLAVHSHLSRQIGARDAIGARARRLLVRTVYPRADALVTVSGGVRDDLIAYVGPSVERAVVIYNPAVPPDLDEQVAGDPGHRWLVNGGPPVVLGAGRLARPKDFGTLIRAFAHVVAEEPESRLIITGESPPFEREVRGELEALVAELGLGDVVDLPGRVPNVLAIMGRASVFALSSIYEGAPLVIIEALAAGTPVVATDCESGPAELLEGGRWGTLVPVGDPEALGRALVAALRAEHDRDALRAYGKSFGVDAAVHRYEIAAGLAS